MYRLLSGFISWSLLLVLLSSGQLFSASNVTPENELKKRADQFFNAENYEAALPDYSRLLSLYPQEMEYNYRFGVCLLIAGKEKSNASTYLEVASKNQEAPVEVWYYLGRSYMIHNDFAKAKEAFEKFKKSAGEGKVQKYDLEVYIKNCESGIILLESRKNIIIQSSIQIPENMFYNSYDFSNSSGKIVTGAGQFLTDADRKKQKDPVMFISNDKQKVLLSSYGKKGEAGKDIYILRKTPDNQWSQPENPGTSINSNSDEDYPFLDRDGRTLYFSSKGHNSIGGYDIFKSVFDFNTNKWSEAENLGISVNTVGDDLLFVPEGNSNVVTYSTTIESEKNSIAIRKIIMPGGANEMLTISGTYIPIDQKVRRDARITVLTSSGDGIITSVNTDPVTGKYELVLQPGQNYMIVVEGGGYLPHSEIFDLPSGMINPELRQEVRINKTDQKEELTLLNYFSSGASASEPVQSVTHTYSTNEVDTSELMSVKINDQVVYVTPPSNSGKEEASQTISDENESPVNENGNLPSIKIIKKDKYDPSLQKGLSPAEITQQKEEAERLKEIKEEEAKPENILDYNVSNEELAKIAYQDAHSIKEEADSLKKEVYSLKNKAVNKQILSDEFKYNSESTSIDSDSSVTLLELSETHRIAALELNRKADELMSIATSKEKEANAAYKDADEIFNSKGTSKTELASDEKEKTTNDKIEGVIEESEVTVIDSLIENKENNSDDIIVLNDAPSTVDSIDSNQVIINEENQSGLIGDKKDTVSNSQLSKSFEENTHVQKNEPAGNAPTFAVTPWGIVEAKKEEPISENKTSDTGQLALVKQNVKDTIIEIDETQAEKNNPEIVNTLPVEIPIVKIDSLADETAKKAAVGFNDEKKSEPEIGNVEKEEQKKIEEEKKQDGTNTTQTKIDQAGSDQLKTIDERQAVVPDTMNQKIQGENNSKGNDLLAKTNKSVSASGSIENESSGNSKISPTNSTENSNSIKENGEINSTVESGKVVKDSSEFKDPKPVVAEAKVAYRAFQEKMSDSKQTSLKSLELQNKIHETKPSPERDQMIRESNDLAIQSVREREEAVHIIQEARKIDPAVEYKMSVNDFAAAKNNEINSEPGETAESIPEKINESNSTISTAPSLAINESKDVKGESERAAEIIYTPETESEEGMDKAHPDYPKYSEIKVKITEKQVETIDVFAEAVNLNKKAMEEKDIELSLMDKARIEKDNNKKSEMLKESFLNKDLSEEHSKESQKKFVKAQEHTREVKVLRKELAVVKDGIMRNPVRKDELIIAEKNSGTGQVENSSDKKVKNSSTSKEIFAKEGSDTYDLKVNESEISSVNISNESSDDFKKNVFSVEGSSPYSEKNPIPMNPELPEGIVFKVQVGAFHKPLPADIFKGLQPVSGETTRPGWIRYCVGLFKTFEPANIVKNEVRSKGYKDAFVVAYYNGKRIDLYEAYKLIKKKENLQAYKDETSKEIAMLRSINIHDSKKGSETSDNDVLAFYGKPLKPSVTAESKDLKEYTVQVGVYRSSKPPALLTSLKPLQTVEIRSDLFRFTSGKYPDYKTADLAKRIIIEAGVKDAFVTVYKKGIINEIADTHVEAKTDSSSSSKISSSKEAAELPGVSAAGIVFRIQIGAYKNDIPYNMIESYLSITDMGITYQTDERNLHIFYAGSCSSFTEASLLKEEIIKKGVVDAFIVALQDGKRITITEDMKK